MMLMLYTEDKFKTCRPWELALHFMFEIHCWKACSAISDVCTC